MYFQAIFSNVIITNYFTIFLQIIDIANFYWFLFKSTTNIIYLFINNNSPHQQFVKRFVALTFSTIYLYKIYHKVHL